jgi:hypothetical protein
MTIGSTVCWPTGDRRYGWGVIQRINGNRAYVYFWPWIIEVSISELCEVKS